ncbi:hypothetical protein G9A89_008456 [Geosiphon pyriformis]|nr:hypothetical protein G9A89_008456 [Geosiphon pyriformis]
METVELKRNRPYAHKCQPTIKNNKTNYCNYCRAFNYYEWIPWERLSNSNEIARGGFGTIYKATYIDGLIDEKSIKHYHDEMGYERKGETEVTIKFIKNSEEVFKELHIQRAMFIKGGYLYYLSLIYGITQNTQTLEYGIVMEFAKHGDMRKYLSSNFHSTNWRHKLQTAREIARGLESIHSSGMDPTIKRFKYCNLSDSEIETETIAKKKIRKKARKKSKSTMATATKKNIYGVIPYIPPEVSRGENFTMAGDIYSFAMLLWELATEKPPFHDCSHDHILLMNILDGARPKITSPLIPPCIAEIIEKCWDANPKNRPTAREVEDKLWEHSLIYERFTNRESTDESGDEVSIIEESKTESPEIVEFLESDKYVKDMLKKDSTTNYLTTTTVTPLTKMKIHPGAIYTSRVLSLQMIDFSKG